MSNETDNQATVETDSGSLKTAVILVHGIGEQWPMDTLWSFLDAAWINDRDVVEPYHNIVYSKPSFASDNMELRRITTRSSKDETKKKFVFYEYYWAHMMVGNKMSDISRWIVSLI